MPLLLAEPGSSSGAGESEGPQTIAGQELSLIQAGPGMELEKGPISGADTTG